MPENGRVSPMAKFPSPRKALSLIGGKEALDDLHEKSVKATSKAAPIRLRLAIAITARHYVIDTEADLAQSLVSTLDEAWEREHMAWSLNTIDGPWAQHMSGGAFAWATVSTAELADLGTRGDFVEMAYLHLR
jgi:hypothetical protein